MLSLTSVQEGFFLLNFQGYLSPLEAFATSVAVLHSRRSSSPLPLSLTSSSPSPSSSSSSSFSSSSHKIKQIPSTFDQTLFRTASTKKKHYFKSPSRYRRKDEAQIPRVLNAGSSYIDVEDSIRGAIEHCNKSSST